MGKYGFLCCERLSLMPGAREYLPSRSMNLPRMMIIMKFTQNHRWSQRSIYSVMLLLTTILVSVTSDCYAIRNPTHCNFDCKVSSDKLSCEGNNYTGGCSQEYCSVGPCKDETPIKNGSSVSCPDLYGECQLEDTQVQEKSAQPKRSASHSKSIPRNP
jgi:hypothetical protein